MYYIFLPLLFKMFPLFFFLPLHALNVHVSNLYIELSRECLFLCLPRVADKTQLDSAAPGGDQAQDLSQEPLVFLGLPSSS